jgi:hypothetical protein
MTCEFAHEDAAYVLGALSPAERAEYRTHLSHCAECTQAVQELAGLPGLLARVPSDVLESPPFDEPVPDTLLPALVRQARRTQLRRTWVTAAAAAAAAVIVAGGSGVARDALTDDTPNAASGGAHTGHTGQAMVPLGSESMSANLAFTSVPWGTRLDLTCTYPPADEGYEGPSPFGLFVHARDGRVEKVATWRALPGKTMRLTAATATSRGDIASVEVRAADGKPVLKLAG